MMTSRLHTIKSILLSALMALFAAATAFAAENLEMVAPGIYQMTDGSTLSGVYARGIDVSRWQGVIDWAKVAKSDVKFAMIATRNRRTGMEDPYFHANMRGAHQNGIALGAYIYSYALNPEEARQEAEFVLNLVKDYPITYPIAFDVEDEVEQGKMTKQQLSAIIDAFCDTIKAAGYYPIVYANENWLNNKLDASVARKYPIWVARYAPRFTFPNPVMWQASSTGKVDGIAGNVDINYQFKSFDNTTPADTWRTILGERYYYVNYRMQKNTWANDKNQRFYLNSAGTIHKGWLNLSDREYYLNPDSGALTRGWERFEDQWSFFDREGVLQRGWILDGNRWYLLDKNGYMLTNWVQSKGNTYYLNPDGSMATGWIRQNNSWLYLQPDGAMAKGWVLDGGIWYYLDKQGYMLTGFLSDNSRLYYMNADGSMATGWIKYGDAWYYCSGNGAMQSGWISDGGEWYFLGEDGKMVTGLHSIDQNIYYFEPGGKMLHSTVATIDGIDYEVGESGVVSNYPYSQTTKSGASKDVDIALASVNHTNDSRKEPVPAFLLDSQIALGARQTSTDQTRASGVVTRAQGDTANSSETNSASQSVIGLITGSNTTR